MPRAGCELDRAPDERCKPATVCAASYPSALTAPRASARWLTRASLGCLVSVVTHGQGGAASQGLHGCEVELCRRAKAAQAGGRDQQTPTGTTRQLKTKRVDAQRVLAT